jgi:hypothetical protein
LHQKEEYVKTLSHFRKSNRSSVSFFLTTADYYSKTPAEKQAELGKRRNWPELSGFDV